MLYIYAAFFLLMSLLSFALMGADKRLARKKGRRIPERTLFLAAFFGGSLGGLLGMQVFRHKTKHLSFCILFPLFFLLHLTLSAVLFYLGLLRLP